MSSGEPIEAGEPTGMETRLEQIIQDRGTAQAFDIFLSRTTWPFPLEMVEDRTILDAEGAKEAVDHLTKCGLADIDELEASNFDDLRKENIDPWETRYHIARELEPSNIGLDRDLCSLYDNLTGSKLRDLEHDRADRDLSEEPLRSAGPMSIILGDPENRAILGTLVELWEDEIGYIQEHERYERVSGTEHKIEESTVEAIYNRRNALDLREPDIIEVKDGYCSMDERMTIRLTRGVHRMERNSEESPGYGLDRIRDNPEGYLILSCSD